MSITYGENELSFSEVIYEDEVVPFRDFLQEKSGEVINLNFTECEDVHLAILQLIMAYKKNYDCKYTFGDEKKIFQNVLEGFDESSENCG
jgi:hypothetical protein